MRNIFLLAFCLSAFQLYSQPDSTITREIIAFQDTLNKEYKNPKTSPLEAKDLKKFKGHTFYPVNLPLYIVAKFIKEKKDSIFTMQTTTDRKPEYVKYGTAIFEFEGKEYALNIFQNVALRQKEEYKDYLFLPFRDKTNGTETYGGGRFIDLKIPSGDSIVIDFNKAYNPYCAYNHKYSCPIPPKENHLDIEIPAGIMLMGRH